MNAKNKKGLVDPRYAKGSAYHGTLKEIAKAKVCPFCPKTFSWHTKPILRRTKNWLITENFNPYANTKHHFIIVGKKHREKIEQLRDADLKEIFSLVRWAIRKYKIAGGGLAMRFGDTAHTGATVLHLHAHLIVSKMKNGKAIPVYFPFG